MSMDAEVGVGARSGVRCGPAEAQAVPAANVKKQASILSFGNPRHGRMLRSAASSKCVRRHALSTARHADAVRKTPKDVKSCRNLVAIDRRIAGLLKTWGTMRASA
eukprot:TRINITY_DN27889_c0_g1_i1.p1 TRINITY_DN27889_c0_g1~~TRINITY_DN27889_c0_g1_i1.p1  ORF type:complete len:106 (-),score=18.95 TRINITY_DN27889_c0_g1_i1:74-391(-)